MDFYAMCLFVPFMFSVGYGVIAQAEMFDAYYGLNNLIVAIVFVSILILADYYHSMNYFHINLKFFKLAPISNSKTFTIKLLVELFGYKIYLLACAILLLAFFNRAYIENITYYLHPITFILLIDIYAIYCLLSLIIKQTITFSISTRWVEALSKLAAILIIIVVLTKFQHLNIVEQFMNSKLLDVLNNEFWIVHVILGVLLAISYPLLIKFIDWKR